MFTGIVEHLGEVAFVGKNRLGIAWEKVASDLNIGDSVSVNGVCLTVVGIDGSIVEMDVVDETYERSNLGSLVVLDKVNLERPRAVGERLDGHIVQGHVDVIGKVTKQAPDLWIKFPPEYAKYLVEKGSITIDGVSLTLVEVHGDDFSVVVIPHTMGVTTLGTRRVGDMVNLEFDVVAKYVEKLLGFQVPQQYR